MVTVGVTEAQRPANRSYRLHRKLGRAVACLVAFLLSGLMSFMPATAFAATAPKLDTFLGVANNSAGDKSYKAAVDASQGQMVQLRLYYENKEKPGSNNVAQKVRVKFSLPGAGKALAVKASVQSEGGTLYDSGAKINTGRDGSTLQYMPGSAIWRHNAGSLDKPRYVSTPISDQVVTDPQGLALENQKPGKEFGSTVTIRARVGGSGVKVTAQTQQKGQAGQWSSSNNVQPGSVMRMLVGYQNTSQANHEGVAVRAMLNKTVTLNRASTTLTNSIRPEGTAVASNDVASRGLTIGDYRPGSNAYVSFEFTLPAADRLACGDNRLQNVGVVRLPDGSEYYATAVTNVVRDCAASGTPTPVSPSQPIRPPVKPATPGALPGSGPGDVVALFVGVSVAGALVHQIFIRRRLVRDY